MKTIHRLL